MAVELFRITKLLSERGVCSRREAEQLIDEGRVYLNGEKVVQQGVKATRGDRLEVRGRSSEKITIMLHKPLGIVSNLPEDGYTQASELITKENQWDDKGYKEPLGQLNVVGRLDVNSKGLLILTQDGRVAKHIIGPDSSVEKEYIVRYRGFLSEENLRLLRHGLFLDGKPLKRAVVDRKDEGTLRIILQEGKKRQLRRMCELVGLEVFSLKRVRVGSLNLGDLPPGKWRFVDPSEISLQ